MNRKDTGRSGEETAANLLISKGYIILERNYTTPLGEIDIIARDGKYTVFVEVRTKSVSASLTPEESITPQKIKHLQRAAKYYIMRQGQETYCRFDVVAIVLDNDGGCIRADIIQNAI